MTSANAHTSLRELVAAESTRLGRVPDPAQRTAIAKLDALRTQLLSAAKPRGLRALFSLSKKIAPPPRGLYLWGGVGRGKTWLMDLFYSSLPFRAKRRRHFHRFMHDVHAELKTLEGREAPIELIAERLAGEVRVLCFDELFVTDIGDAMILGTLFESLFRRGVALVVTSNVPPSGLYREGLQRARFLPAIALLEKHTEVLNVDGGIDYRLRQLGSTGLYLRSGASDTQQKLAALFQDLGGHDATGNTQIEIAGRMINVRCLGDTVVWFDFSALCDGPRSQDDYIELAREFPAVIVSDVPILDQTLENPARRFIAVVDEFYDRGVKLIVSAAAEPGALYRGQRLKEAFLRTESRLMEMQSEAYLRRPHLS